MAEKETKRLTDELISVRVCNCRNLNIRKSPNQTSEVLKVVSVDTFLTVKKKFTNGWAKVIIGGKPFGYVMTNYIKER